MTFFSPVLLCFGHARRSLIPALVRQLVASPIVFREEKKKKTESTERELDLGSPAFGMEYYILKAVIFSSIDSLLLCCFLLTR